MLSRGDRGAVRGHHTGRLGGARGCAGPWARRVDGGSGVGLLRVLRVKRLRGQRLLRHHRRPSRVAHGPHVRWRTLGLAGHAHGLLGHVWHLTGVELLLLLHW